MKNKKILKHNIKIEIDIQNFCQKIEKNIKEKKNEKKCIKF